MDSLRHLKQLILKMLRGVVMLIVRLLPQTHHKGPWSRFTTWLWQCAGIRASNPVFIDKGFKCIYPNHITMGSFVSLGHDNCIWAFDRVSIGNYTQTAKDLLIIVGAHHTNSLIPKGNQQVIIGPGCWIGARVTILGGINIGKGAIIGAGALVNKDVPDFAVVTGNPAKVIKYRDTTEMQWNPFQTFTLNDL